MTYTSFLGANEIVDRFINLLSTHGISPPTGQGIEAELLSVTELLDVVRSPSDSTARPDLLAVAGGMFDLAAKLLAIETQPEFKEFIPHLKLFASKEKWASSVQTTPGSPIDDVHRKLNELYLGSLAVHIGSEVELDHPDASRGDNPDVMFTFELDAHPPKRWTFAIKTVSSRSGQTIFERIAEASRQINAPSCPAQRGIVVINTQGSLNHSKYWDTHFPDEEDAKAALRAEIRSLIAKANDNRDVSEWNQVISGKTSPVILYFGHIATHVPTPAAKSTPTVIKMAMFDQPTLQQDAEALAIVDGINRFMQRIQKGIPGTEGTLPR